MVSFDNINPMNLWNSTKPIFTTLIKRQEVLGYEFEEGAQA